MKMEIRFSNFEVEPSESGSELLVTGYANKTNQLSEVLGKRKKFREKILPGAFTRAIENARSDIHLLLSHDDDKILASTRNGSLKVEEDSTGLRIEARISPTTYGKDAYQLVKDGILTNMSFGMAVKKDEWRLTEVPGLYERSISSLELYEVSIVRDPAYSQTVISARGIDMVEDAVPEKLIEEERKMNEEDKKILSDVIASFKVVTEEARGVIKEIKEERAAEKAEIEAKKQAEIEAEEHRKAEEETKAEELRKAEELKSAEEEALKAKSEAEEIRKAEEEKQKAEENRSAVLNRLKEIKEETKYENY